MHVLFLKLILVILTKLSFSCRVCCDYASFWSTAWDSPYEVIFFVNRCFSQ